MAIATEWFINNQGSGPHTNPSLSFSKSCVNLNSATMRLLVTGERIQFGLAGSMVVFKLVEAGGRKITRHSVCPKYGFIYIQKSGKFSKWLSDHMAFGHHDVVYNVQESYFEVH
jgi:hypothetical protein